jgi:hypothetical protein
MTRKITYYAVEEEEETCLLQFDCKINTIHKSKTLVINSLVFDRRA